MAKFDSSNWTDHKPAYIVMIALIVVAVIYIYKKNKTDSRTDNGRPSADGNGNLYYLGRGSRDESVEELLNRIEWSTYLEKRIVLWRRLFVITLIIVFFLSLLVLRKIPTPAALIVMFMAVFVPMYASHQLYYVHGDVYNDYYIKRNTHLIRKKLHLKKGEPNEPRDNIADRINVMHP